MTVTDARVDAPREDLVRMSTELRSDGDGNTLVGYAAVFEEPTEIDSWEGRFIERIAPGAFRKTLRERGNQIKVLFNHGMDPQIGDKPLGTPAVMREDDHGLYVEVPLADTSYNKDIRALLASGALNGMSFRMTVTDEDWQDAQGKNDLPQRTIKQVRLYEFGPVTFPAYQATQAGVRAHAPSAFAAWRSATKVPARDLRRAVGDNGPLDDDPDEDPIAMAQALDAVVDAALDVVEGVDTSGWPAEALQVLALIVAADSVADDLLESLGADDPDDDDMDPEDVADGGGRTAAPQGETRSAELPAGDTATGSSEPASADRLVTDFPGSEPPTRHSPPRSVHRTEMRKLTIASLDEVLEGERARTDQYRRSVADYERRKETDNV